MPEEGESLIILLGTYISFYKQESLLCLACDYTGYSPSLTGNGVEDFVVYCDASNQGLGRVLMQRDKSGVKGLVLADQGDAFKDENVIAEGLNGTNQQMEKREDGSLHYMDRIWVTLVGGVRTKIMDEAHKTRDGHFTLRFWQTMQKALGTRLDMSTVYHPQTDGQSECTIQTLEDMLRACVIDFGRSWNIHFPLAKFSYNNSYHSSIRCAPFKALYGRKCVLRFGKKGKLAPRFVGPFKILERIGPMAYGLRLPEELSSVHDTFHVSILKKCLADANLHVPLDEIKVDRTLHFVKEPLEIIDCEVKTLKRSKIPIVKVRWNSKRGPKFTWEREDHMKAKYPQLFENDNVETNG
nr:putative reverse transcriptase domain-containing protein [Tanacetum cinerariifolium]